jgi:ABC-type thiamin/hydroxymethylpyrimidine transport system permease subunit
MPLCWASEMMFSEASLPKQISLLYLVSIAALAISSELIMAIHFWSNHNWLSAILLTSISVPFAPFVMPFIAWAYWANTLVNILYFSVFSLIGCTALMVAHHKASSGKKVLLNTLVVLSTIGVCLYWSDYRTLESCFERAAWKGIEEKNPSAPSYYAQKCYELYQ